MAPIIANGQFCGACLPNSALLMAQYGIDDKYIYIYIYTSFTTRLYYNRYNSS